MKKCLKCPKQATLHITELKGGQSFLLHLCENCAKDYLSTVDPGGVPDEFTNVPSLLGGALSEEDFRPEGDATSCPHCGMTFKQFRSQGRLGCPHDYDVFRTELVSLLESIHGETQHVGKFPPKVSDSSRRQHELIRLRNELKTAIDDEHYEQAAQLRDQINNLEAEMKGSQKSG